jgi:hypothetical protein
MNKRIFVIILISLNWTLSFAGNPDRQGEAGAYELLMNPWARSAGLHSMTTSFIRGVEAMRINVAGLSRIRSSEFLLSNARYLEGTDIRLNALGFATKVGENGVVGVSLMSINFGDIDVTTTDQPEGTGGTYSPNFFNLGLAYAHTFENKVSVGILVRGISESTADLTALGFAIDAGVQYVTGPNDNFKFGISLRNVGSPMKFSGEGLSFQGQNPDGTINYDLTFDQRAASFELPSALNIGLSYDFLFGKNHKLTTLANFTSNSFSLDQLGAGLEYTFRDMFSIRGGYKYEISSGGFKQNNVYTGVSAGISFDVPFKKGSEQKFGIDYGYRASNPWSGSHNFSIRFSL